MANKVVALELLWVIFVLTGCRDEKFVIIFRREASSRDGCCDRQCLVFDHKLFWYVIASRVTVSRVDLRLTPLSALVQ
jgi:hypothetical protein